LSVELPERQARDLADVLDHAGFGDVGEDVGNAGP
jgi:hypothetical protein